MSQQRMGTQDSKLVNRLVTPEIEDLFKNPNATSEELEDAVKDIKSSRDFMTVARAYYPVQEEIARRPTKADDTYIIEQGTATQEQYHAAVETVAKEHRKRAGVHITEIYPQALGMVFFCPKDMVLIQEGAKEWEGLVILKNSELKK